MKIEMTPYGIKKMAGYDTHLENDSYEGTPAKEVLSHGDTVARVECGDWKLTFKWDANGESLLGGSNGYTSPLVVYDVTVNDGRGPLTIESIRNELEQAIKSAFESHIEMILLDYLPCHLNGGRLERANTALYEALLEELKVELCV